MKPIKKKHIYDPFDSLLDVRTFIEDYPFINAEDMTKFKAMLKGMMFNPYRLMDELYGKYWSMEAIAKYNMILRDLILVSLYEAYTLADTDDKRNYIKWRVKKLYKEYYENNNFNKCIRDEFY